ncbi:MAG: aminotransferase class V-fold PLP-dependent enzyme [Ignavibacteriales bacterium]|nr:MAG: aminotransferase class V-fold PLP-dependent enzyme [Ignavibacteriales bacterium]
MNKSEVRNKFPYLDNGIIYFNHAATGPFSSPVVNRLTNLLIEKSENNIDDFDSFIKVAEETKILLAELINCNVDRIAFVDNTTNGLNIPAQSIDWKKGDRILLNDIEFPANVYPFLNLKRIGVEVDFVKSENGIVTADQIINSIKPETKLVSVSFVQFLSGYKVDLEKIGNYCRANNIIFSVDGIQGIGAMRVDVKKCKIDFLSCGTQKWLLGMQGLAFIYVDEEFQKKIIPANVGWLSVENAWDLLDYKLDLKTSANVFQGGTLNTFGIYAFNSSLTLFKDFGFDNVESEVLSNTKYFITKLKSIGLDCVLSNCNEEELAGIVTIKVKDPEKIFDELEKKKIFGSLREGFIRFAPHFYNTHHEIDKVVEELQKI